jgi:hypothetical protein
MSAFLPESLKQLPMVPSAKKEKHKESKARQIIAQTRERILILQNKVPCHSLVI